MVIPFCGLSLLCFVTTTPWDRPRIIENEPLTPTFRSTQVSRVGPDPPYASANLTTLCTDICKHVFHHLLDCCG